MDIVLKIEHYFEFEADWPTLSLAAEELKKQNTAHEKIIPLLAREEKANGRK